MSATAGWTVASIRDALTSRKISARELAAEYFSRIEKRNPELNAYLALSKERANEQAARVDAMVAKSETLPRLAGVPLAIKDVLSTTGTAHHLRLENSRDLRAALRRDRDRTARPRRRDLSRQDQLRRVRDGQLERKFGLRASAESSRPRTSAGRLQWRLSSSGSGRSGGGIARN